MANWVQAAGYSLGKLHTGMLAYLCDLHREGISEPLESLFGSLGVAVPAMPGPRREWNSVDLAVFDGGSPQPKLLVETRVDDTERETARWIDGARKEGPQTEIYADAFPGCSDYLFVTLGMGEFHRAPHDRRFRWIRIRPFLRALDEMRTPNPILDDWRDAVRNEVDLQDRAFADDRSRLAAYRSGAWNVYRLGDLGEAVGRDWTDRPTKLAITCYAHGRRPDTILNFGFETWPQYLEINNNGRLNFKINLEDHSDAASRQRAVRELASHLRERFCTLSLTFIPEDRIGKSKTVASLDIGLSTHDDALSFTKGRHHTVELLRPILRDFYG